MPIWSAWGVMLGVGLFAVLRSRSLPASLLGAASLVGVAGCIVVGMLQTGDGWKQALGLKCPRAPAALWLGAGLVPGILLGVAYRGYLDLPPWPGALGGFLAFAAAIGAMEELIYRGYVQTGLRGIGPGRAILLAAAGHTAYKCLLFAWRPGSSMTNLVFLAVGTFLVGIGIGALRDAGRSIWPPILGHAGFDVVVYGALHQAPWWVWG